MKHVYAVLLRQQREQRRQDASSELRTLGGARMNGASCSLEKAGFISNCFRRGPVQQRVPSQAGLYEPNSKKNARTWMNRSELGCGLGPSPSPCGDPMIGVAEAHSSASDLIRRSRRGASSPVRRALPFHRRFDALATWTRLIEIQNHQRWWLRWPHRLLCPGTLSFHDFCRFHHTHPQYHQHPLSSDENGS